MDASAKRGWSWEPGLPSPLAGEAPGVKRELLEFRLQAARGLHAPASPRDGRRLKPELQQSPPHPQPSPAEGQPKEENHESYELHK